MYAEIVCCVITSAVHLSQYLKMRFGRGMQLLGSIQFLVATVRQTSLCSQILCIFEHKVVFIALTLDDTLHEFNNADICLDSDSLSKLQASICLLLLSRLFPFSQLLYTGIVIYAPALILNQGRKDHLMSFGVYALVKGFHSSAALAIIPTIL